MCFEKPKWTPTLIRSGYWLMLLFDTAWSGWLDKLFEGFWTKNFVYTKELYTSKAMHLAVLSWGKNNPGLLKILGKHKEFESLLVSAFRSLRTL